MRYYIIFLFLVLFSSFCLADETTKFYKTGTNITLSSKCIDDETGALCSDSAECNISITYPNGQNMVKNQEMVFDKPYFLYNLSSSKDLGVYSSVMCCSDGDNDGCGSFSFVINNIGSNNSTAVYIACIICGLFLLFSLILTYFFYLNDSWLKYLFLFLDFLLPAVLSYFAYLFIPYLNNSMSKLLAVSAIIFTVLSVVILFLIALDITLMLLTRLRDAAKAKEQNEWGSEIF